MELWTRRVRGVGATSDMRMTHADMANHHRMRKPWGFQEVSRKTWQILWTWGMGAWQIVYMANYGSPVSRKGTTQVAITHTRLLSAHPSHTPRRAESQAELERGTHGGTNGSGMVRGGVTTY